MIIKMQFHVETMRNIMLNLLRTLTVSLLLTAGSAGAAMTIEIVGAGANHGDVVCSFHSGALHSGWGRDRRRNCDRLVRNLLAFHRASQQVDDASKTTLAPEALFVLVKI